MINLIHPIYLDVPMLVSFAAALEGGVSLRSEVTQDSSHAQGSTSSVGGEFGISNLFANLFSARVQGELESESSNNNKEIKKEIKSHTEASIAILLYSKLKGSPTYIKDINDITNISQVSTGSLVELTGVLEKNAVDTVIDYIDAITIMTQLASDAGKKQASKNPVVKIKNTLDEDRKRTPISSALLRTKALKNMTAIVTLRRENLRDLTLSELSKNQVTVVGKVTRIIQEGEYISSFENYGMSLITRETVDKTFDEISNVEDINANFTETAIDGPSLQILPLMIFV